MKFFLRLRKNISEIPLVVWAILVSYILLELLIIRWGIPNTSHPFTYHMDEWHQTSSSLAIVKLLSPNRIGAANGSIFHFLLTDIYMGVLYLLHIINPFVIKSSLSQMAVQEKVFILLRLNTLLFGIGTILVLYAIVKKYIGTTLFQGLGLLFFVFTPIWISLSNYFKYDIGLLFWIVLALYFFLSYIKTPTQKGFFLLPEYLH